LAKAKEADADAKEASAERPRFETLRAIFWAAVIALAIRSFVVEPFKIPSGSMIPTLLVGDYVLVNKFAYGVRLPGDKVEIRDRRLTINGKPVEDTPQGEYRYPAGDMTEPPSAERFLEKNPEGVEYTVLQWERETLAGRPEPTGPWIVPQGQYFMMGDNRDNSADSRRWRHTFVSPEAIKGKAFLIHWSWVIAPNDRAQRSFIGDLVFTLWRVVTFQVEEIRWHRIGHRVSGPADP